MHVWSTLRSLPGHAKSSRESHKELQIDTNTSTLWFVNSLKMHWQSHFPDLFRRITSFTTSFRRRLKEGRGRTALLCTNRKWGSLYRPYPQSTSPQLFPLLFPASFATRLHVKHKSASFRPPEPTGKQCLWWNQSLGFAFCPRRNSPPYLGAFRNRPPASAAIKNYGSVWVLGSKLIPQKPYKLRQKRHLNLI